VSQSSIQKVSQRLHERRAVLQKIRSEVRDRRAGGMPGIACCEWLSDQMDELLRAILREQLAQHPKCSESMFALTMVGGSARRRPAPYSDVDLLLLMDPRADAVAKPCLSAVIRDCWDAGLQLGSSIRTPSDTVQFALNDTQFATSLIETRFLSGNESLYQKATAKLTAQVFNRRPEALILKIVASRREEWMQRGNSVNQLEPDIKRSPGGLRDLHLLRWISFVRYGQSDPAELHRRGAMNDEELAELRIADEFLSGVRVDVHCLTGLKQDVLTRELQMEISRQRNVVGTKQASPVEVFMKDYFGHTSRVAAVARRIAEVPERRSLLSRLRDRFMPQKVAQRCVIVDGFLCLPASEKQSLRSPVQILDVFVAAAENNVRLSPELRQWIGEISHTLPEEPDREVSDRFRDVLRCTDGLPNTLRTMYETGILQWLIPPFAGVRNLMQFNQYHSFTVDEHTLKAMDEMVAFARDDSPVGSAYHGVRHRATLHLAMLMHDVGKGLDGDHSIVGEQLCEQVAVRLQMAANKKSMLMFLVRYHLIMPDLAFRRDISDPTVLLDFARLVGAPELLRMLYVLTVADIRAVGPDTWSDWKGELLADLYGRAIEILSGRPYNHLEQERLQKIRSAVRNSMVPLERTQDAESWNTWADAQLDALPPFYLMMEQPDRIARDLDMIHQLNEAEVKIEGNYEAETETVSYRVFAPGRFGHGSFHSIAGILSGLRMNILAAQVCTTSNGVVIAFFRVSDNDFTGPVPQSRIEDVAVAIGDVLTGKKKVESVFRKSALYRTGRRTKVILKQDPKVGIDNDCSERFTVIDVFATDTQGLLYTLAHTLFNHGLTVHLARIATNIDQVVDVFYVLDEHQRKLEDPERLERLKSTLLDEIHLLSDSV
jgi:[protein-PII] uridylyltransferase